MNFIKPVAFILGVLFILNFCISNFVYNLMNQEKTTMQIFLRTNKNFIWDFNDD